ncbi:M48 family peptidase [Methylolobus aquaticus]|nr:M48 family peptidase [Methylolobus aquaticus]
MASEPLLAGLAFPLHVRRSCRAKRLRLIVRAEGVECVLPARCSERIAREFIRQHHDWLVRKYREAIAHVPAQSFWQDASAPGDLSFPLQAAATPFLRQDPPSGQARVSYDGEALRLTGLSFPIRAAQIELLTFSWARGWLAQRAEALMRAHAERIGVHPRQLRIKRMRTRWGSCGAVNDINLNWLLVAVPPAVLEYVVVHELCHIRHRNHSAHFWALVNEHFPDWGKARQWLKAEGGRLLHRFGPVR